MAPYQAWRPAFGVPISSTLCWVATVATPREASDSCALIISAAPAATATSQLDRFLFFRFFFFFKWWRALISAKMGRISQGRESQALLRTRHLETTATLEINAGYLKDRGESARSGFVCLKAAPELFSLWVEAWRLYFDKNSRKEELLWIHHPTEIVLRTKFMIHVHNCWSLTTRKKKKPNYVYMDQNESVRHDQWKEFVWLKPILKYNFIKSSTWRMLQTQPCPNASCWSSTFRRYSRLFI